MRRAYISCIECDNFLLVFLTSRYPTFIAKIVSHAVNPIDQHDFSKYVFKTNNDYDRIKFLFLMV